MDNITQIVHKVRQAPWRVQRQWVVIVLLGLVLIAMVAGVYVNVTARAAISGRQIQELTRAIEENRQKNADIETELAGLYASESMQRRAEVLGFHPATRDEIIYLAVAGYLDKSPVDLSTDTTSLPVSMIKPEYSETFFDWITRRMTEMRGQP